jgi:hypothetical protein
MSPLDTAGRLNPSGDYVLPDLAREHGRQVDRPRKLAGVLAAER